MRGVETQKKARVVKGIPMWERHTALFGAKFLESQADFDF